MNKTPSQELAVKRAIAEREFNELAAQYETAQNKGSPDKELHQKMREQHSIVQRLINQETAARQQEGSHG